MKKFFSVILSFCLLFVSLYGCSSSKNEEDNANASSINSASATSQTETPTENTTQASNAEPTQSTEAIIETQIQTEPSTETETKINYPEPTNTEISYGFLDYNMFNNFWSEGTYRCGSDFEPGNYYIMSISGAEAVYDVADSPNSFNWSYYRVFRKISVKEGQYVKLSKVAILVPENEIDTSDLTKYGIFLVGKDLPEGDYKITTITNQYHTDLAYIIGIRGAYQICDNSPTSEPLACSPLFDEQEYISVKNGQYIIINNAKMVIVS